MTTPVNNNDKGFFQTLCCCFTTDDTMDVKEKEVAEREALLEGRRKAPDQHRSDRYNSSYMETGSAPGTPDAALGTAKQSGSTSAPSPAKSSTSTQKVRVDLRDRFSKDYA